MEPLKNVKHERFCVEYVKTGNASQSYISAGYKATGNAICVNASKLLSNTKVAERIAQLSAVSVEQSGITLQRVIQELRDIGTFDPADIIDDIDDRGVTFKAWKTWPENARRCLASTKTIYGKDGNRKGVEVKFWSKPDALKTLTGHFARAIEYGELDFAGQQISQTPGVNLLVNVDADDLKHRETTDNITSAYQQLLGHGDNKTKRRL